MEYSKLKLAWCKFHKANPSVYALFNKFTFQVIARGHKHYSSKAIFERIRWHTDVETVENIENEGFKISNNHTAYYARYWMHRNPEHASFFRQKRLKSDNVT
tara:strand:+ start:96 stop:401 length:306 start_codon:yes stop_codon:yes gene_type:complete